MAAGPDPLVTEAIKRGNQVVFFDITIGGQDAGRIKMELFTSVCPKVKFSPFFTTLIDVYYLYGNLKYCI